MIYYGTLLEIWVKSYCRLNLIRASIFNLECFIILRDSIGHSSKKLLSFEFDMSFRFQFGASRYIPALNRTSEYKVIFVWICSKLLFFPYKSLPLSPRTFSLRVLVKTQRCKFHWSTSTESTISKWVWTLCRTHPSQSLLRSQPPSLTISANGAQSFSPLSPH